MSNPRAGSAIKAPKESTRFCRGIVGRQKQGGRDMYNPATISIPEGPGYWDG
jgi:hypothetical protein